MDALGNIGTTDLLNLLRSTSDEDLIRFGLPVAAPADGYLLEMTRVGGQSSIPRKSENDYPCLHRKMLQLRSQE